MDDSQISRRPDVRPGVLRRWICPVCRVGTVWHSDPAYGSTPPPCGGLVSVAPGLLRDAHDPCELMPLDVRHDG